MVDRLGMTPAEVLAAATGRSAEALGIDDRVGSIAEGYRADLVPLDANPLIDIRNTSAIRTVVGNGPVCDAEGRAELFRTARRAPAHTRNDWHPQ